VTAECLVERKEPLYSCQILIVIPVWRRDDVNYKLVYNGLSTLEYCAVCVEVLFICRCMYVRIYIYIICIRISIQIYIEL
jgi:hypothetical protein